MTVSLFAHSFSLCAQESRTRRHSLVSDNSKQTMQSETALALSRNNWLQQATDYRPCCHFSQWKSHPKEKFDKTPLLKLLSLAYYVPWSCEHSPPTGVVSLLSERLLNCCCLRCCLTCLRRPPSKWKCVNLSLLVGVNDRTDPPADQQLNVQATSWPRLSK